MCMSVYDCAGEWQYRCHIGKKESVLGKMVV